ncbi:hypothetical protein RND61_09410 [Streptomyces sp. TRM76323]|uniref:Lipoprotein n=1 Tax=Streptomyces tamarix TaxID=3078565 RepID=A0ABU3QHQ5_9ACTN|nr:hypothetical protein [Streptomyces tamarix]MDT9682291.1 hypothetical protein [Streptomyces tamarix]
MTRIHGPIRQFTRPGRALAVGVLASLTLVGCGTDQLGNDGAQDGPDASTDSKAGVTSLSADQASFAKMLDRVAQPCPPPGGPPVAAKPASPQGKQSLAPGETPPTDPIEPGVLPGPESVLNARDWCASVQHEQRIIEALQMVSSPTPANVRKALNSLGYIDEHIHELTQDGKTTRFYLDLRENGGRLCEAGTAAGETTDVSPCVAPATGAFAVEEVVDSHGTG